MKKNNFKSLLLAGLMMVCLLLTGIPAYSVAADEPLQGNPNWSVKFTKANKMESNFKTSDIDDVIRGMQPGDSAILKIKVTNENAQTTAWYLENKVISTLVEDRINNAGGAYTYKLTYTNSNGAETVLFTSETVGGDADSVSDEGLKEATNNMGEDDWLYLDELETNESGQVTLEVGLDGETQGNAYQDTLADLTMNFAVELVEPTQVTPTPTPGTRRTTTVPTTPRTSVRTGDESTPVLYLVLMGVAGILMLIIAIMSMRARKQAKVETTNSNIDKRRREGR
ncbi:MAG: hypothetical protein IJ121_02120 [Eubacterium sp.]|nr:hypothetical protein [Eubacterium sp.]